MTYDVVVVGAGNAALCAALSAHEGGARVLVLEKAPEEEKGGNSYFTAGGFRFAHDGLADVRQDILDDLSAAEAGQIDLPPHDRQHFYEQLMKVTRHQSDEELAWILIDGSRPTMGWLRGHGIRFIPMFGRQSYQVDGKHRFYGGVNIEAVGGGQGLVEAELARVKKLGIEVRYGTGARRLVQDQSGRITGVAVDGPAGFESIDARAVILAALTFVLALPVGLALAWVLLSVINVEAFGWQLPMHTFPLELVRLFLFSLLAAGLAALWPARRLSSRPPSELIQVFAHER